MSFNAGEDNTQIQLTPGIGYVLGVQYNISDRFYIEVETMPNVNLAISNLEGDFVIALTAGFDSTAVAVTAVNRFFK